MKIKADYIHQLILVAIYIIGIGNFFDLHSLSFFFFFCCHPPFYNYYMWTVGFAPRSRVLSVRRCRKSSQLHSRCWVFVPVPKWLGVAATNDFSSMAPCCTRCSCFNTWASQASNPWNDRLWVHVGIMDIVFSCGHSSTANDQMARIVRDIHWWDGMRCHFLVQRSGQDLQDLRDLPGSRQTKIWPGQTKWHLPTCSGKSWQAANISSL